MPETTSIQADENSEQAQWTPEPLPSLQRILSEGISTLISNETEGEELVAYAQLLSLTRNGSTASLIQEQNPLYDKVFYQAKSIKKNSDGTYVVVTDDAFVRLNDTVNAPHIPTVAELRNKTREGILFSWVAALTIKTREGARIPLLKRDALAPTDPGKYTLPAGRADKSPGLTAYEECLEEIIILGRKNGKLEIIIPYLEGAGVTESKAKLLVGLARARYLTRALKWGEKMSKWIFHEILNAPFVIQKAQLGKGETVKTIFETGMNEVFPPQCIEEAGILPYHDEKVNTFEFIRSICVDLREYDTIEICDGDWFWREAGMFHPDQVNELIHQSKTVSSLRAAFELWAFKSEKIDSPETIWEESSLRS